MDRRRTGGELPLLLVGWPWYQEVVGLSDEDKETESSLLEWEMSECRFFLVSRSSERFNALCGTHPSEG